MVQMVLFTQIQMRTTFTKHYISHFQDEWKKTQYSDYFTTTTTTTVTAAATTTEGANMGHHFIMLPGSELVEQRQ